MRRPYVCGNWKLWGTRAEARDYCGRLPGLLEGERTVEVGLCVPFTAIDTVIEELESHDVRIAAQNMYSEDSGAFTGEVSAPMLLELGVDSVVLGHSERREHFGETDAALRAKVPKALEAGLAPILCIGETEAERESGDTERKLRQQVGEALSDVESERLADVTLAYEPVWAIGTGKTATPDQAQEAMAFVRALVGDRSEEAAEQVRVLYGGSVKPDNAAEIMAQPDVDGALVGGASTDPEGFAQIVAAAGS
ncbi:MAG: triose-phosphate isomerase [Actinomycetota bacterium]|nr:triose-phosphate isomerase [Actinomycetota bacterium]MDQ3647699.1 triose-phosphate isomerase [Actinomycetota bacterium]